MKTYEVAPGVLTEHGKVGDMTSGFTQRESLSLTDL
jgi:hypothetical protein